MALNGATLASMCRKRRLDVCSYLAIIALPRRWLKGWPLVTDDETALVRNIQTRSGHVGYRSQLDRARRFLDKVQTDWQGLEDINEVEFQDMMWSFFQHCWHVKDWLRHDPLAPADKVKAAIEMAHQSGALLICRDLCNGTKHLHLDNPSSGAGASHQYVDMNIVPGQGRFEIDCMIDDGHGTLISGKQLARDCIAEWERILSAHGLAITRQS